MLEDGSDPFNNRMSQLLGALFILCVITGMTTALHEKGIWHDIGINLTSGIIMLAITVLVADTLIKKHNEERYDPHRRYMYSMLQRTVSDVLMVMFPPDQKSCFKVVYFGRYSSTCYDINNITLVSAYYYELYKNTFIEDFDVESSVDCLIDPFTNFIENIRVLRKEFFTLLSPEMLEILLQLDDDYSTLDIVKIETRQKSNDSYILCAEATIIFVTKIYLLQKMLLGEASEIMSLKESQQRLIDKTAEIENALTDL